MQGDDKTQRQKFESLYCAKLLRFYDHIPILYMIVLLYTSRAFIFLCIYGKLIDDVSNKLQYRWILYHKKQLNRNFSFFMIWYQKQARSLSFWESTRCKSHASHSQHISDLSNFCVCLIANHFTTWTLMVIMASYVNKFNSHIDNHDDSLEQYKSTSLKGGLIMSVISVPSLYKCKFYYWQLNYINTSMDVTHFDLSLLSRWVMKLNTLL